MYCGVTAVGAISDDQKILLGLDTAVMKMIGLQALKCAQLWFCKAELSVTLLLFLKDFLCV
jgi:hypothetical protein